MSFITTQGVVFCSHGNVLSPSNFDFRSLNRQQSWGSNPTQSNSFKVIQKMTEADNDDFDFNAPMMEYPPTFPQNFQTPADQMGRMKISDGDMMNRFNQGNCRISIKLVCLFIHIAFASVVAEKFRIVIYQSSDVIDLDKELH